MIEIIDPDTLAIRLAAWKTVVLDIRKTATFRRSHIPESVSIPFKDLAPAVRGLPLSTSISVVCDTGKRSHAAAAILWELGYRHVAVLRGGLRSYARGGLPMVGSRGLQAPLK